jgi:hypothetical protein
MGQTLQERHNGERFVDYDYEEFQTYYNDRFPLFNLYMRYKFKDYRYGDAASVVTLERRRDKRHSMLFHFTRRTSTDLEWALTYTMLKNSSNYDPGEYDKEIISLQATKQF